MRIAWHGPGDLDVHDHDNTFKRFHLEHGEVDDAFAAADLIVEGEYHTGAQEQLYIETNGMIAEVR